MEAVCFNIFILTYRSGYYSIQSMEPKQYFLEPTTNTLQKQYEALRAFFIEGLSANEVSQKFGYSPLYFKKIRYEFIQKLKQEENPFFQALKTGSKKRFIGQTIIDKMVILRKQNYSIHDIRITLESEGYIVSLEAIDDILKAEGFAPLPRRTRQERLEIKIPSQIIRSPQSSSFEMVDKTFFTERGAGPLIFLPLIEKLGIINGYFKY